jgi:ketosteroid isomerase-like protein
MKSKHLKVLCIAPLLLGGLVACQPNSASKGTANIDADLESIRAEADAWSKAITDKDLEKTLSFYAPDAQYLSGGRPAASTPDERRSLWVQDYATAGFSSEETTTKIEVARSGDLAYQRGTYAFSAQDDKGKMTQSTGKFVVVWKKQGNGQWKAIIDIDNADQ